jgi:hypothetical protein
MHQGHPKEVGHAYPHVTGIGIVGVDDVGEAMLRPQEGDGVVGEGVEIVPEFFFADVFFRTAVDAYDVGVGGKHLRWLGIVLADAGVHDAAGQEVHAAHFRAPCQRSGKLDHIQGLSPGVRIPTEFQVMGADETVDADMKEVEAVWRERSMGRGML